MIGYLDASEKIQSQIYNILSNLYETNIINTDTIHIELGHKVGG